MFTYIGRNLEVIVIYFRFRYLKRHFYVSFKFLDGQKVSYEFQIFMYGMYVINSAED